MRRARETEKEIPIHSSIFIPLVSIFKDVSLGLRGEVSTFHRIFYHLRVFCEKSESGGDFSVLSAAVTQFPRAEKLRQIIHSNFMDRGEIKTDTLTVSRCGKLRREREKAREFIAGNTPSSYPIDIALSRQIERILRGKKYDSFHSFAVLFF